jgi:hypothetical protein
MCAEWRFIKDVEWNGGGPAEVLLWYGISAGTLVEIRIKHLRENKPSTLLLVQPLGLERINQDKNKKWYCVSDQLGTIPSRLIGRVKGGL